VPIDQHWTPRTSLWVVLMSWFKSKAAEV